MESRRASKPRCTTRTSGSSAPAQIVKIEGQPGMFDVTLEVESASSTRCAPAPSWWRRAGNRTTLRAWRISDTASARTSSPTWSSSRWPPGADRAAVRRPARQARALRTVRRLARPGPPAVLLVVVLHDDAGTDHLHPRTGSGSGGLRGLQGHPDARAVRAVLPRGAGSAAEFLHQGRSGVGGEGGGRTAGGHGGQHPAGRIDRVATWTWWCWPPAWCPTAANRF